MTQAADRLVSSSGAETSDVTVAAWLTFLRLLPVCSRGLTSACVCVCVCVCVQAHVLSSSSYEDTSQPGPRAPLKGPF